MNILSNQEAQNKRCPLHIDKRINCQVYYCMAWKLLENSTGYCTLTTKAYENQIPERPTH